MLDVFEEFLFKRHGAGFLFIYSAEVIMCYFEQIKGKSTGRVACLSFFRGGSSVRPSDRPHVAGRNLCEPLAAK